MFRAIVTVMLAGVLACGPGKPVEGTAGETTGAGATTAAGSSSTGGGTTGTTAMPPTSSGAGSSGGGADGVWRGRLAYDSGLLIIHDCASGEPLELLRASLPFSCGELSEEDLFVEVSGVLHPDSEFDSDWYDEIEVTQILAGPCRTADCGTDEWTDCAQFEDVCFYYRECDVWGQDCPAGEKCMPYASLGDLYLDSLKCVPVVPGAGGEGEPCTVEGGGASGIDTCAEGHICWGGTCVVQCTGSPEEPQCSDPCTACLISYEGLLNLCYLSCDPLAQECPDMDLCVANPMNPQLFICVIDASGEEGQLFDPCEYANACDPGLFCASPQMAVECDQGAAGCCLPFCDLTAPACPGAGQQCVPWSGDEPQPGCIQNVGMCRVP